MPGVDHRRHRRLNNRAENSHQPTRQRERTLRHFKSPGHAQRFLSAFTQIPLANPDWEAFCEKQVHFQVACV